MRNNGINLLFNHTPDQKSKKYKSVKAGTKSDRYTFSINILDLYCPVKSDMVDDHQAIIQKLESGAHLDHIFETL